MVGRFARFTAAMSPSRLRTSVHLVLSIILAIAVAGTHTAAQSRAGAYRAPRAADGKPDLRGIWQAVNAAAWDLEDHPAEPGVPAGQSVVEGRTIPYLPAAAEKRAANRKGRATLDPDAQCYLSGVPRATYTPFPFRIDQNAKFIVIAHEYNHTTRVIPLDGSPHPDSIESWMGDSRGRWEGETLVVDVASFNDATWFDKAGNFHSNALHVIERFTRTGPDHLQYEATIEDPKVFSRPWKISMPLYRRVDKDVQLLEYECVPFVLEPKR